MITEGEMPPSSPNLLVRIVVPIFDLAWLLEAPRNTSIVFGAQERATMQRQDVQDICWESDQGASRAQQASN